MLTPTAEPSRATPSSSESPIYSSRIIKATALLPDTRSLLAHWDAAQSVDENLGRMRAENVFGKASRSRIADMLAIFKQRYLHDDEVRTGLVTLANGGFSIESLDCILYYLSARNDALLHDAVTEFLLPAYEHGQLDVSADKVMTWLREQMVEGKMEREWSYETTLRAAKNLLATLRDFGVMQGATKKQIVLPYLPLAAFCFIAMLRQRELRSGELLVNDCEWQLFFLPRLAVERMFLEAHQEHLVEYQAAGRIIRITFPTDSLPDYARLLTGQPRSAA